MIENPDGYPEAADDIFYEEGRLGSRNRAVFSDANPIGRGHSRMQTALVERRGDRRCTSEKYLADTFRKTNFSTC